MTTGNLREPEETGAISRIPLSSVDTAWLRMEGPAHPMMLTVALIFGAPIAFHDLRMIFERRLLGLARFRQRAIQPRSSWDMPYWEADPTFDLSHHLGHMELPPPGDQAALQDVVSKLMSQQLDFSRPLWRFHLVDHHGEGCALVGCVHHCLAGGPALMRVLHTLVDPEPTAPRLDTEPEWTQASEGHLPLPLAFRTTAWVKQTLLQGGAEALINPLRWLNLARVGTQTAKTMSRMILRPPDPKTVFRGKLSTTKRATWSEPVALEDVKAVGQVVGGTVNDVMLAAVTGALRHYMQDHENSVEGVTIRAGLSVNLHPPDVAPPLGNHAGAVLVELPIGLANPLDRLLYVKWRMDQLKTSPEASLLYGLLAALGTAPAEIQDTLVDTYCSRETAMIANILGPKSTIQLAGAPLETILFWLPAFGRVGLGLSIISYAGQVRLGVAADQGLVPDPGSIAAAFRAEFGRLLALARQTKSSQGPITAQDSLEAMHASLDEALAALDAILEKQKTVSQ